jgi:hypothetical protein
MSVTPVVLSLTSLLADDDTDKGSPIGLFVVLILVVAVYFLYRSLSRHVRRIPESFDPPVDGQDAGSADLDADPAAAADAGDAGTG